MTFAILEAILVERAKQDAKFGSQGHEDGMWARVLGEEYGEVMNASLRENYDRKRMEGNRNKDKAYELIQVAAVAVAWLKDIATRRRWEATGFRKNYVNLDQKNGKYKSGRQKKS